MLSRREVMVGGAAAALLPTPGAKAGAAAAAWGCPEMAPYWDELIALSWQLVELGRDPRRFTYRALVLCEIDDAATARAVDGRLRYKPSQDLLETLAAMRTAKGDQQNI